MGENVAQKASNAVRDAVRAAREEHARGSVEHYVLIRQSGPYWDAYYKELLRLRGVKRT